LNLYWYRNPLEKKPKGMILLPSIPIQTSKIADKPCFLLSKDSSKEGRSLTFLDNQNGHDFKLQLANMIYYKLYIESSMKKGELLDSKIVDYFTDPYI